MRQSVALTIRLNSQIYESAKLFAKKQGKSFTGFVQTLLEEKLKKEEKKDLFGAFSIVGKDSEESCVDYAFDAQREVILKNE